MEMNAMLHIDNGAMIFIEFTALIRTIMQFAMYKHAEKLRSMNS